MVAPQFTIVGLGESLFDIFPERRVLGGAPLNVAVHAHQLAGPCGGCGLVVSRVGQDELGQTVFAELQQRGMSVDYLQTDPDRDTGRVYVAVDAQGQPDFEIVQGTAWDWLQFDPDLEDLARRCEAVCFGSLAQRNSQARNTIYRFLDALNQRMVRMFDVNLRQDYFDQKVLQRSFEFANVAKLNDQELPIVADLLGVTSSSGDTDSSIQRMIRTFDLNLLVLTRGEAGTVIYAALDKYEGEPISYEPAQGADAVGAGDACAAAILIGLVRQWPMDHVVEVANHTGAFVASQPGATPQLPESILAMVKQ
ncbi:MAG: PfkB family carbohydrate kinase [Pirellulaceae bacterium]|nr:PfkB family carbohydrate kinase [Pirellulaceae bacterium]